MTTDFQGESHATVGEMVLPFYLVVDESPSMDGEPIRTLNTTLPDLHFAVAVEPVISEKIRFGIITFSGDAQVTMALTDLSTVTQLPGFAARDGGTNYDAAFRALESELASDIARLKSSGHRVLRPAVFFLSDGQPNGPDWTPAYKSLMNKPWHPNIMAFGLGDADANTIGKVASLKAFMVDRGVTPAAALSEFAKALVRSVVSSGSAIAAGQGDLQVHDPEGFTVVPLQEV